MGQYYYPMIKTKKELKQFNPHNYMSGLKLMEHSYIGDYLVQAVLTSLLEEPGRICWRGDYADEEDFEKVESDIVKQMMLNAFNWFSLAEDDPNNEFFRYTYSSRNEKVDEMFIVNHSKKEYINLKMYKKLAPKDEYNFQIHPLPLLTAAGNGKGGGDYYGNDRNLVGYWCCDEIAIMESVDHLEGYKDITEDVIFVE